MARSISRAWRMFATCAAFVVFHVSALLIALPAIVVCRCWPGAREDKELRVQRVIHLLLRFFIGGLVTVGLLTCTRRGLERLASARGCVVVANHPTLLDVVLLIAAMPRVDCVVKEAVWKNVFTRATARSAGYVPNHDGALLVDACAARIARGRRVLLFPEGTRSPAGALHRFQRGAARIALRSGSDILPIVITCEPPTLLKGMRWYEAPERRPHFTLTVMDPISIAPYLDLGKETPIGARRLTESLEAYFAARVSSENA